jgi:hypothetical protein
VEQLRLREQLRRLWRRQQLRRWQRQRDLRGQRAGRGHGADGERVQRLHGHRGGDRVHLQSGRQYGFDGRQNSGAIIATASGSTPPTPAFIIVDNVASDSTAGATLYFEGTVKSGMNFYADSTVNALTGAANPSNANSFAETLGGNYLYAHIFSSEAAWQGGQAATQEIKYSVSGAAAVDIGDKIGSLKVAGYVSTTNQGFAV